MSERACPACGARASEFDVRCPACGADLPSDSLATAATVSPEETAASDVTVSRRQWDRFQRGAAVGRFTVIDRLGDGGMGIVVSAHDPALDRTVAIKVLRPMAAGDAEKARARLLREAQAMAKLAHPDVVTVHEVGVDGDQVFVVMERVDGQTLRAWMEAEPRSWREVLDRFSKAGRGLSAAHRAGLVHRDFKPDNVLVSKDGRVLVTDFGLAGVGDPEPAEGAEPTPDAPVWRPLPLTSASALLGTPAYMAPEQHRRRPVDARADQFAFAVSLYEGLYGERPFEGDTYAALCAAVLRGEVREAPRGAAVPSRVRASLLRALSVDPERRYPSMEDLLAALARDPSAAWRRAGWIAAIAALSGLAIHGLAKRPDSAAALCKGAEQRLAGVWDAPVQEAVHKAMLGTGRPFAEDTYRRVAAEMDRRAGAWEQMYTDSCEATHLRGEQSAHLLDLRTECFERRRAEMGALTGVLSSGPDAEVLARALDAVLALPKLDVCAGAEALLSASAPPDPAQKPRVDALRARVDEAAALQRARRPQAGLDIMNAAAVEAEAIGYAPAEADALALLGRLQSDAGDYKAAEATLRRATTPAAKARDDRLLAGIWTDLVSVVGLRLARFDEALALETAGASAVERAGADPVLRGRLLREVALVLRDKGSREEAVKKAEEAVAVLEKSMGPEDAEVARTIDDLGTVLFLAEQLDRAQAQHERALRIREKVFGPDHPDVASSLNNLGNLFGQRGDLERALGYFVRAAAIVEKTLGPDHPQLAEMLNNEGVALSFLDRLDQARACQERALAIRRKAFGPADSHVAESLVALADVLEGQGKSAEAQPKYEEAIALFEKTRGPERILGAALQNLGESLIKSGKAAEAEPRLVRAIEIQERIVGKDSMTVMVPLTTLGECYLAQKQAQKALSILERALAIAGRHEGNTDPAEVAAVQIALARALWDSGDRRRAVPLAKEARAGFEKGGDGYKEALARVDAWLKAHR